MNGNCGYGYDSRIGQDYDPSPPRLQAYAKHAQRLVTAMAAQRPTTPFFVWILDADGREYVHPFTSRDEMAALLRRKSQPSRNFYYMAVFNRTGPVWPAPESSAYGCHSPEWNTWPSEFPPQPGPCPSTVSGGYVGQAPPGPPPVSPNLRAWAAALNSYLMERGRRATPMDKGEFLMQAAFEHFLAAGMSDQDVVRTFSRVAEHWANMLKTYRSFQRMPSTIPAELLR